MLWAGIVDSPHVPPRHLALSRANHADGARRPLQHHRPLPARPAGDVHVRGEPVRRAGPGRDRLRGSRRPCRPGPGSGRIRSLPSPSRGTRIGSSTGSNCDHNGQALLALLDGEVDSAGQTPAGASEPVVGRLDDDPAGGSSWRSPFRRPGGVLVGPADGGVDVDGPGDQALRVGFGLELREDPCPGSVSLPASEQVVDPVPRAIAFGHVTPRGAGPSSPPHAVYQLPPRPHLRPTRLDALRQQRLEPGPLAVRQIPTIYGIEGPGR